MALLAFAVLTLAAWKSVSHGASARRPDPRLFTIATRPPELPTAPPPTAPGAAEYEAGLRLMNEGDLAGAVASLAAAVAASPGNADYHNAYGHALWRSGDPEGGLSAWAEAARLDPRYRLQYARELSTTPAGARRPRASTRRSSPSTPDAVTVHEDVGRLLYRSGDYAKAAPHLQRASQARPDDPVLRQELAYALDQSGQKAQAVALYREVLTVAPQATISRGLLAEGLFEQGQKDEALAAPEGGYQRPLRRCRSCTARSAACSSARPARPRPRPSTVRTRAWRRTRPTRGSSWTEPRAWKRPGGNP